MKNLTRNPILKLTAMLLCAVAAVGLILTTSIAVVTGYVSSIDEIGKTAKQNIASNYVTSMMVDYMSGDTSAIDDALKDVNMDAAVIKSNYSDLDRASADISNKIYGSSSLVDSYDFAFRVNEHNAYSSSESFWDSLAPNPYADTNYEDTIIYQSVEISSIAYCESTGLFYVLTTNGSSYIIPKIRLYTADSSNSQLYTACVSAESSDGTTYEYRNAFSDEALDTSTSSQWTSVSIYDASNNFVDDLYVDIESPEYSDVTIYVTNNTTHDLLPEGYILESEYYLQVPVTDKSAQTYYWVYVTVNDTLSENGDYFSVLAPLLSIANFTETHMSFLFLLCILVFLLSAGYLVVVGGKRKGSEEMHLRLIDRVPYLIVFIGLFVVALMLCIVSALMINYLSVTITLVILAALVMVELLLTTYVRFRAHKFIRYTLCHYIWALLKKIAAPVRKFKNLAFKNIPLFLIASAFFFILTIIEVETVAGYAYEATFIVKLIEYVLLIMFVIQFDQIKKAAHRISLGDFSQPVDTNKLLGFFKSHGEDLNNVSNGIETAVQEKMKSEHFRTELITNVSHDIKTPLTSIINYVDLLEKEDIENEKVKEYLDVLDRQSARLKKLIEDLMEASKASTGNLTVIMESLDASMLIGQVGAEFEERFANKNLELILNNGNAPAMITADGRHLWRVFDNLMNNIYKYAQPNTRVYVDVTSNDAGTVIEFKNISAYPLNISSEELMERFVRGDSSRNTEGSGLGLSIAQSLMQLMNGELSITIDGDLFKATLRF